MEIDLDPFPELLSILTCDQEATLRSSYPRTLTVHMILEEQLQPAGPCHLGAEFVADPSMDNLLLGCQSVNLLTYDSVEHVDPATLHRLRLLKLDGLCELPAQQMATFISQLARLRELEHTLPIESRVLVTWFVNLLNELRPLEGVELILVASASTEFNRSAGDSPSIGDAKCLLTTTVESMLDRLEPLKLSSLQASLHCFAL